MTKIIKTKTPNITRLREQIKQALSDSESLKHAMGDGDIVGMVQYLNQVRYTLKYVERILRGSV